MGEYDLRQCQEQEMTQQKKKFIYLDQWFHREILDYENLPQELQNLLMMNWRFKFYPKIIYTALSNRLVRPSFFLNSYNSSLMDVTPSRYQEYCLQEIISSILIKQRLQNYGNSSYMDCIPGKHLLNFDPRCRGWYLLAMENQGITFYAPYLQISSFSVGMTISQRYDDANDNNLCVYSFNLDITNLSDKYFKSQDTLDENSIMGGYTVFFHSETHTIFYHKNWDRKNGVLNTWDEVEYNSTIFEYEEIQFDDFKRRLQKIIDTSENINKVNINQNSSSADNNILYFEKNKNKYICLIVPIEVTSRLNAYKSQNLKKQKPFFIGRVHSDISDIIYKANFYFFDIFRNLCIGEACVIFLILVISFIHYFAILFHTLDMPIEFLCLFLKQFYIRDNNIQKQRIQKANSNLSATRFLSRAFTQNENISEPTMPQKNNVNSYKKILVCLQTDNQNVQSPLSKQNVGTVYEDSPKTQNDVLKTQQTKSHFNIQHDQSSQQKICNYKSPKPNSERLKNINQFCLEDKHFNFTPKKTQKTDETPDFILSVNEVDQTKLYNRQSSNSNITMQNNFVQQLFNENEERNEQKTNNNQSDQQQLDLKQMDYTFKEMQIIKEAFLQLEDVIVLAKQESNEGNIDSSIINFCVAKRIFAKLKNFQQVSFCYYNLGILCIRKGDFIKAVDYLQSSIQNNLLSQNYGVYSLQEFAEILKDAKFIQDQNSLDNFQKLSQKVCILVYALRNIALIPQCTKQDKINYLQKAIYYTKQSNYMLQTYFHSKLHSSLHINYILLSCLYIDLGFITQAAQYLFKADMLWNIHLGNKDYQIQTLEQLFLSWEQKQQMQVEETTFLQLQNNYMKLQNNNTSSQDLYIHQVFPQTVLETFKLMNLARIFLKLGIYQEGCEMLTRVIEYGQIFDPRIRLEALSCLQDTFNILNLDNRHIQNEILKYRGDPLNIFIILQCPTTYKDYTNQIKHYTSFIQNLYTHFIQEDDKIQVFQFSDQITCFNKLNSIDSQLHLQNLLFQIKDHIISQLGNKIDMSDRDYSMDQSQGNVNWTQALRHIIYNNIYGQNLLFKSLFQEKLKKNEIKDNQYNLNQINKNQFDQKQQSQLDYNEDCQEKIQFEKNIAMQKLESEIKINNLDNSSSFFDLQQIQPEYKKRKDLVILMSVIQEEFCDYHNYVNPFQGLSDDFTPMTFHYQRSIFNESNLNAILEVSIKNLANSSKDIQQNDFQFQLNNQKYNKHTDFNSFFKHILSYRVFQKYQSQ